MSESTLLCAFAPQAKFASEFYVIREIRVTAQVQLLWGARILLSKPPAKISG